MISEGNIGLYIHIPDDEIHPQIHVQEVHDGIHHGLTCHTNKRNGGFLK